MKGLLEMSLLISFVLLPILLAPRSHAVLYRSLIGFGVFYYFLALFVLPRLPG